MPFGKFKGTKISDLSIGYIETLLVKQWKILDTPLKKALSEELRIKLDHQDIINE